MKSMKVLFCSPYKQGEGFVQGGMATWGSHIVSYYGSLQNSDAELIPVSFDRKTYIVNKQTSMIKRAVNGIVELGKPIIASFKIMRNQDIDAIHICTSGSLGLVKDFFLIVAAKRHHVRSVIHFHMGKVPDILKGGGWEKYMLEKVLKYVDVIMTMDTFSFNTLKNKGFNNVLNVPNPLSPKIVDMIERQSSRAERRQRRVFFAGHVVKTKGVYELVEACSTIDDVEVRIAGRYSDDVKNELINIWNKQNRGELFFLGEVSHEVVINEMLEATVLALPSYTEGFPNVILEAMACGCPIVATDVGAISEMLNISKPNKCGVCLKSRDIESLRKELQLLINNADYTKEFGINAKQKVFNDYSMQKIWDYLSFGWGEYNKNSCISFI